MTKWYKPLLLSSLLCSPWIASAHEKCKDILPGSDRIERQLKFIEARDQLINRFAPDKNATLIADVIRHSTAASSDKVTKNALWLKEIPDQVIRHAAELGLDMERAQQVADEVQGQIDALEKAAICYHFGELEYYPGNRLMMLKLYDDVNVAEDDTGEQRIGIGYLTTSRDGNSSEVVHLTYPEQCGNGVCNFTDISKNDFKGTGIRLVHHPEVVETMLTGLSTDVNGDPVVTDLTALELSKTGEIFTKPEIYFSLYYYGQDVEVDKESFDRRMMVDIPWALSKGENLGRTRLLSWDEQQKAHIVIMEDDRDIPFRDIQKIIKLGFKAAVRIAAEAVPGGSAVLDFASGLGDVIDKKDTEGDSELLALLEGWQKNDFIDELVLERSFDQSSVQHGVNGHAKLRLRNMYNEVEKTEEAAGESATGEAEDEALIDKSDKLAREEEKLAAATEDDKLAAETDTPVTYEEPTEPATEATDTQSSNAEEDTSKPVVDSDDEDKSTLPADEEDSEESDSEEIEREDTDSEDEPAEEINKSEL